MNLTTQYMGLELSHPLMPGASPMVDNLDTVRQLEDAGASAIVMHSLFEEQIEGEHYASIYNMEMYADSFAETASFFPGTAEFALNPHAYLDQIRRIKAAVNVPVIASLNGTSPTGWLRYAGLIEQAGADALELNVYHVATNGQESAASVERQILDLVQLLRKTIKIPLAVKLSPFFTALPHLASKLDALGVNGLVLFNRFYQPDIDLKTLDVVPRLQLSDSTELLLRLRWLAILSGRLRCSLACSGGVHGAADAVKAVMAGAHAVQMVSALLQRGPEYLKIVLDELTRWMEENQYRSIRQMQGSLGLSLCADPAAFERGNYMRVINSWRPQAAE